MTMSETYKLETEATFVEAFNKATLGNHQFGGYPNEQYYLFMKYGSEFMANKWSCETLLDHDGKLGNERVLRGVNVWARMLNIVAQD